MTFLRKLLGGKQPQRPAGRRVASCPDNIQQGVGSIREYAASLVGQETWPFWWD